MAGMFGTVDEDVDTYTLDLQLYYELKHFMDSNSTIRQCVGILDRFLFQSVEINGGKELMNKYLDLYFLPFFRIMLRYIIMIGWCPYHIKKIKDPKTKLTILVPEVFPIEYLVSTMNVNIRSLNYEFLFYNRGGDTELKNIKVFMYSDLSLIANGSLIHSQLSSLLSDFRYTLQIKKFTIQSEYVRSNPPIYLKLDTAAAGQKGLADRANAFNGGNTRTRVINGEVAPAPASFQSQRVNNNAELFEKASSDMMKNIEFHQNEVQMLSSMQANNYYNLGLGFIPQWYNNLFVCPPNMTLAANPQLPESKVDQAIIERNLSSSIYLTFGIPETLVGMVGSTNNSIRGSTSRGSNIRKDVNIMDVNVFESTLYRYQNFFQDCFVVLFENIFKKEVSKDIVKFKPPKIYEQFIANVLAEHEIGTKDGIGSEHDKNKRAKTLNGGDDKKDNNDNKRKRDDTGTSTEKTGDKKDETQKDTSKVAGDTKDGSEKSKKDKSKESDKDETKTSSDEKSKKDKHKESDKDETKTSSDEKSKKDKSKESDKDETKTSSDEKSKKDKSKESKEDKTKKSGDSDESDGSDSDDDDDEKRKKKKRKKHR